MKPHLKAVQTTNNIIVDSETGEELEESTTTRTIVAGDIGEFYTTYIALEARLNNLSLSEERVFRYCCMNCGRKNEITFTKPIIERFSKEGSLAEQTIRNCVSNLAKKNLLITIGKGGGVYIVNPRFINKQRISEHRKLLKYVLELVGPEGEL